MLCEFCKKIKPPHKTSNSNEGSHSCIVRHHAQFDNLIHSASEGCEICCLFAPYVQAAKNRRGGPIPKSQDRVLQGLFERHSYHEWWKTDQPFPTTGPEQLWVELYTEDDQIRILPNVNTTYRGSIICLSAGSIGDNSLGSSTLNNYCLDGEPVHDLHTLGQRMPGLRLFDYDPLLMMTHSDYQSPTPAFELYLGSGSGHDLPISGRDVVEDPQSPECFGLAQNWQFICNSFHPNCQAITKYPLPTRLIDVGSSEGSQAPRLCIMENTLVSTNKYVILSHCWGPDPDIAKLTTKNTKEMEKEIEISSLPKNFIDAITVSRGLGFQYLWVDSLCILQDSEDDWAAESPQMGQYYQGAELMISSVTSSCAFRGFLNPREADFEAAKLDYDEADVFLRPVLADSTTIVDIDKVSWSDLRPKIHEQPLNTRAWALQERLFSRRILYFSRQQMIWCCKSSVLTEGGQLVNTPSPSINGNGVHQNRLAIDGDLDVSSQYWDFLNCGWPGIVERYTNRSITYTSDRLPGVSGLAVHFSSTIPVNYAAGLWHGSPGLLEASLLWRRVRKRDKSRVQLRAPTLANNGSPSWSWSYLEAEVRFQEYSRQKFNLPNLDPYFESIETTLATNNSFGQVSGGKITLEGFVHKYAGPSSFEGAEAKRYQEDSESDRHSDLARTLISIFDVPEPGRCWEDGNYVMLFIGQYRDYILTDLTSQEFLILRAIKSMPDHYQRIGVAYTGAWRELLAIEGNKEWTKQRLCLV